MTMADDEDNNCDDVLFYSFFFVVVVSFFKQLVLLPFPMNYHDYHVSIFYGPNHGSKDQILQI